MSSSSQESSHNTTSDTDSTSNQTNSVDDLDPVRPERSTGSKFTSGIFSFIFYLFKPFVTKFVEILSTEVEYKGSFSFLEPSVLSVQSLDNDIKQDARVNSEIENEDTCNDKLAPGFEKGSNDLLTPEIETETLDRLLDKPTR